MTQISWQNCSTGCPLSGFRPIMFSYADQRSGTNLLLSLLKRDTKFLKRREVNARGLPKDPG